MEAGKWDMPARAMGVSVFNGWSGLLFRWALKRLTYDFTLTEGTRFPVSLSFAETEAAFVRLELLSGGLCPKGYFHEGLQSELAIDEIEIY